MLILGIIIACALAAWGWHWLMTRNATPNDAMAVGFGVAGHGRRSASRAISAHRSPPAQHAA